MKKFHINYNGNIGLCRAKKQSCPYGSLSRHFENEDEARSYYEGHRKTFQKPVVKEHSISLSKDVEKLLDQLETSGVKPLIVGGTVRDSLAKNVIPKDVDIEIHEAENVDQVIKILKKNGYKVDEVGKQFGVLKVALEDGMDIDLSLPRRDNKNGVSHKDFEIEVEPSMTISEASDRRDFTINALYYSHSQKQIIDPVGGLKDWENKTLSPISSAFDEDPLRVLRGVQISSRFDLTPDDEYIQAAKRTINSSGELSIERVQEEFSKLLRKNKNLSKGLETLRKSGWGKFYGFDNDWYQNNNLDTIEKETEKIRSQVKNDNDLNQETIVGGYLMNTMSDKQRKIFSKFIIGDRNRRKMNVLSSTQAPDTVNKVSIRALAREIGKTNPTSTIHEWALVHQGNSKTSEIEKLSKKLNVWKDFEKDFVTGQMVLEESGRTEGGVWIGEILREANKLQKEGKIEPDNARSWIRKRISAQ